MIMKWEISTMFETTNQSINHLILTWLSYLGDTLSHHGKIPAVTWLKPLAARLLSEGTAPAGFAPLRKPPGTTVAGKIYGKYHEHLGKPWKMPRKSGTNLGQTSSFFRSLVFLMGISWDSWDSWDPGRDGKVKPYVRNSRGLEKSP